MAGRGHQQNNASRNREAPLLRMPVLVPHVIAEDPRLVRRGTLIPLPAGGRPHPALIEEHIAKQHREMQSILLDNQRLAASHLALNQELSASQQELLHLSTAVQQVKAERSAIVQEMYERSLKMEEEVRSIDDLGSQLDRVKSDIQKIATERDDLRIQLHAMNDDLAKATAEAHDFPAIKDEIEYMQKELHRGRAAIEYEKNTRVSNEEQRRAMEKNMISIKCEIERLRPELANAEKRARAAAAAAAANQGPEYGASFGNSDARYGTNQYHSYYNTHPGVVEAPGRSSFDIIH